MSYNVAPCSQLTSNLGDVLNKDQVTQTDGPNDFVSLNYLSTYIWQNPTQPLSYQNSHNEFSLKRRYEADDESENAKKLTSRGSSLSLKPCSSMSQDSLNEGGSEDEAEGSKVGVINQKVEEKRKTSNGTPVGQSEALAKISGDNKKDSSQINDQSEIKQVSRRSSNSNIMVSDQGSDGVKVVKRSNQEKQPNEKLALSSQNLPKRPSQSFSVSQAGSNVNVHVPQGSVLEIDDNVRMIIPPPEALIQKSSIQAEPAKTGAPIAFVKLQRLYGRERIERLNAVNKDGRGPPDRTPTDIASSATVTDYMINAHAANRLVYCRFGEKYIQDLEKRKNSVLAHSNQPHLNLGSASYLINIKKLIEEHNIDGEKRDFKSMKTKSMGGPGGSAPQQFYKAKGPDDKTLIFESRFESGNLLAAIKISDFEYDLVLQNDINTNGHTQWFFYRVSNTRAGEKTRFNIINLAKPDSLYNYGMKVLNYSNEVKNLEGIGWHRIGENIDYYQNCYRRDANKNSRCFYTLTFDHVWPQSNDQVFFAHCFPYTYSDLQDDLVRIEKDTTTQNFFHRSTLCRTLAGNRCEYLTITSKDKDPKSAKALAKKGVFISARIHPGESNSSWMMKGVIDFLTGNSPEAKALRENFVFKIVPILNPDGVINGNYRCSLSGQDLNRRWKTPSKILHPVVFAVKKFMRVFSKEREIILYCDLHGHSRRKNIFMYGNNLKDSPHATRVFPYIMSKLCDFFSFEQSRFSISKYKEATARIAMYKELNIPNIFTLEASFCGADRGKYKDQHFSTEYLMLAGRRLLESLIVYCKIDVHQSIKQVKANDDAKEDNQGELYNITAKDLQKELMTNKKLIQMTQGRDDGESSGSDSEPSADNLDEEEMASVIPKIEKQKVPPPPKKPVQPIKVKQPPKPKTPPEKKRTVKPLAPSPQKRPLGDFNRLRTMRKVKPEMKDAWTQTTPRAADENRKYRRQQREAQQRARELAAKQQAERDQQQMQQRTIQQMAAHQAMSQQAFIQNMTNNGKPPGPPHGMENMNSTHQSPNRNDRGQRQQTQSNQQNMPTKSSLRQQQNHLKTEGGNSPQPQIRIRKEQQHFKQKASNDLANFEQRLLHHEGADLDSSQAMSQQHRSYKVQGPHSQLKNVERKSSKNLPEIPQSSSSQRKNHLKQLTYDGSAKKDDQMIYNSANNSQISNNKIIRQNSRGQNSNQYNQRSPPLAHFQMPSQNSLNNMNNPTVQQRYQRNQMSHGGYENISQEQQQMQQKHLFQSTLSNKVNRQLVGPSHNPGLNSSSPITNMAISPYNPTKGLQKPDQQIMNTPQQITENKLSKSQARNQNITDGQRSLIQSTENSHKVYRQFQTEGPQTKGNYSVNNINITNQNLQGNMKLNQSQISAQNMQQQQMQQQFKLYQQIQNQQMKQMQQSMDNNKKMAKTTLNFNQALPNLNQMSPPGNRQIKGSKFGGQPGPNQNYSLPQEQLNMIFLRQQQQMQAMGQNSNSSTPNTVNPTIIQNQHMQQQMKNGQINNDQMK